MYLKALGVFGLSLISFLTHAQHPGFDIALEPMDIPGLGGLQSYAYGQHNGTWLIVGGRLDGLHRRQPFAAFDAAGNNTQLIAIDPVGQLHWSASLSTLPVSVQEQLQSTNMQSYQMGDYLYLTGGYGYSATAGDHTTFGSLLAIDVPAMLNAVVNGGALTPHIRQISDPLFQVAGGQLRRIGNTFYLIGGNKFLGRYNPMGPNHGPGFVQEYTNQIRPFRLTDDGTNLSIVHLTAYTDSTQLHRRDFNVVPQILPNGAEGITAFSGVFQPTVNLPFRNSVTLDSTGYTVDYAFEQHYNHYHCGVLPLYSAQNNQMHSIFFGGIAQFYDSTGTLIQDDNVPFVKTIARVTRDAAGILSEHLLPVEMPGWVGAGAEFIPVHSLPHYPNEVLQLDALPSDSTLVGYIYGGISSTAENIFFTNTGSQSSANSRIFKVYVVKSPSFGGPETPSARDRDLGVRMVPNPNQGRFAVRFYLAEGGDVDILLRTSDGKKVEQVSLKALQPGEQEYVPLTRAQGGLYFITIQTQDWESTQKVVIRLE